MARGDYPPEALLLRQEGRVVVEIEVGADGRASTCRVAETSGSRVLDESTCRIGVGQIVFTPAKDERGRSVAGTYKLAVRWKLSDQTTSGFSAVDVASLSTSFQNARELTVRVRVTPMGAVAECTVLPVPPQVPGPSLCDAYPVGKSIMPALMRDGRPVGVTITQTVSFSITFDP